MNGNGGSGKKSESGKESDGTARGRRSERGKESENGRETKTATAGPEKETETETETGRGTEAVTGAPSAADPGEDKKQTHFTDSSHQIWEISLSTGNV